MGTSERHPHDRAGDAAATGTRHLALGPGRTVRLHYEFANRQPSRTSVWLAICPDAPGQAVTVDEVTVERGRERSDRRTPDGNELKHVELEPGGVVTIEATVTTAERALAEGPGRSPPPRGSPEACLAATPMIPTGGDIAASARRILSERGADGEPDAVPRARAFFDELVEGPYSYVYPPAERGAAAMLLDRRGDCGEFSSLFAAWCRSDGIPARIVYGTWAHGRMQGHAWNEFWLDGVGWVPVDASLGWAMRHKPWNWLGQGLPLRPDAYFSRLDGARIGFSYGPDVAPEPPFEPVTVPVDGDAAGARLRIAGRGLTWGVDTLDGALPYLQPAYPRFTSPPQRGQELLGTWSVKELGVGGRLEQARRAALLLAAVFGPAFLAADLLGLPRDVERIVLVILAVAGLAYLLASLGSSLVRRSRRLG